MLTSSRTVLWRNGAASCLLRILVCFLLWPATRGAWQSGFLIVSSPETGTIYYSDLPSLSTLVQAEGEVAHAEVLIDGDATMCSGSGCSDDSDQGLKKPTGLALHQGSRDGNTLYVSDVEAGAIYAYELAGGKKSLFKSSAPVVGKQRRVRSDIDGGASCLAVDGDGNLFYATGGGQVEMISAEALASGSTANPVVLYSAADTPTVAGPSSITTDGFKLYWANQNGGGDSGTVASAISRPGSTNASSAAAPMVLADNLAGAYGVCSARGTIFFSAENSALYAVKATGGAIAEVSTAFGEPRGCAHDGESTLYVADAANEAVYSLTAVQNLRAVRQVSKVMSVASPSQVVVFSAIGNGLKGPPLSSARNSWSPSFGVLLAIGFYFLHVLSS